MSIKNITKSLNSASRIRFVQIVHVYASTDKYYGWELQVYIIKSLQ